MAAYNDVQGFQAASRDENTFTGTLHTHYHLVQGWKTQASYLGPYKEKLQK
jgi:hypothetical protein